MTCAWMVVEAIFLKLCMGVESILAYIDELGNEVRYGCETHTNIYVWAM